jgi:hypothetical protein
MARARKYDITAGVIYQGKKQHRRVIATFTHETRGERIVYSVGGDASRECGYLQFRRWATRVEARRVNPDSTPRFSLRGGGGRLDAR